MTHKNQDNYQSPPPTNYITTSLQYSPMLVCYTQLGYQAPQPNYQIPAPSNQAPRPNYRMPAPNNQAPINQDFQNLPPPANYEAPQKKPIRVFTPLPEPRVRLFAKLRDAGRMNVVPPKPANPKDRWYRPDFTCTYHSNIVRHTTEYCINLRHKLQDMIDNHELILEPTPQNVDTNPPSKHEGNQIHMIERGDEWERSPVIIHPDIERLESTDASLPLHERKEVLSPLMRKSEMSQSSVIAKKEPFLLKYPSTVAQIQNEPFVLKTSGPIENAPFVIKSPHLTMVNKKKR
ncbi:altered inheritance of mitochondria protein 3-like [Lycium ferocissimum]|uniref:altered inheritance of mitochondria protein 3-like n=1 Tax=Lycium ferocissimum TaxID=112874 RepID=UPI00281698FC|nr:altered inheritance of mitochondria protein 3-like [Lycium ferocissimum]